MVQNELMCTNNVGIIDHDNSYVCFVRAICSLLTSLLDSKEQGVSVGRLNAQSGLRRNCYHFIL